MRLTSTMHTQSLVEIGGHTATGDEKQWCFCLYVCMLVCMFVTLECWMSGKEVRLFNTYTISICGSISKRFLLSLHKETGSSTVCGVTWYYYFWFLKRNGRHIKTLLAVSIMTFSLSSACGFASPHQISSESDHLRLSCDVIAIFKMAAVSRVEFGLE